MNTCKVYQAIARTAIAQRNCEESGNTEWESRHADRIERIVKGYLPHGSGFDASTHLQSADESKLVFLTGFHHMDENGFYCGWSSHTVTVTASLAFGIDIELESDYSAVDKSYTDDEGEIAYETDFFWHDDYVLDQFQFCLTQDIEEYPADIADPALKMGAN